MMSVNRLVVSTPTRLRAFIHSFGGSSQAREHNFFMAQASSTIFVVRLPVHRQK